MENTTEVLVIGAGFAGLVAARELSQRGHSVAILEARDRIAGRTHLEEHLGRELELGGTWVHWTQPYVWAEMGRYGIDAVPGAEFTKAYWNAGGQACEGTADELLELLDEPNRELLADARRYFPMPWSPLQNPQIAEIDGITLSEAIDRMELTESQRQLLRSFWTLNFNGTLDEAAYSQALRWAAVASGSWQLMFEACATFKISGGTRRLTDAILDDSSAELHLGHRVASISQDFDGVRATTTDGREFRASQLVLALPLGILADLQIQPALSSGKLRAAERGHAGRGAKLWVKVKGRQEHFVAMGPENAALNFVQAEYVDEDSTTLVCFGPEADRVDTTDVAAAQRLIDALVPDLEVLEIAGHNWVQDKDARSTWPMHYTGFLTESLAELQRPEGRIRLAGSDIANGWGGFIDGAIESGLAAARAVHLELQGNGSWQDKGNNDQQPLPVAG
ncbi:flavin monoamine oxidase family protein [Glutamicibacter nicotianae]|uniref:flavin monoamine oxidase family protein n=1 Tax=Glutamicibacter nicotianae TaxID=37929 RepID=UPI0025524AE8|nr:NAD(P)/FAD-dependent oxidoreductase [Glutamicibacter nicotianae]WIV43866.1 NAD(P)/FAD-dependent oxidoreductase [Glutamicibacter nicotianae]